MECKDDSIIGGGGSAESRCGGVFSSGGSNSVIISTQSALLELIGSIVHLRSHVRSHMACSHWAMWASGSALMSTAQSIFACGLAWAGGSHALLRLVGPMPYSGWPFCAGGGNRAWGIRIFDNIRSTLTSFVEDRLATLKNVIKEPELDGWNLYLGDWGYNTQKEREEAATIPRIRILELSDFSKKLK
ncbi:unnamed protein product [Prunus armeniaca]